MKVVDERKYRCRVHVDLALDSHPGMARQCQADEEQQYDETGNSV